MTTGELLHVVLRRWYLMVLGAAVSVGVLYAATHQPAVYWTQYNLLLLQPINEDHHNYLSNPRHSLYPLAGVVVRDFNPGNTEPLLASPDTMLVGQGLRQAVQVRLPNQGSQWEPVFQANYLDVQVVDESPEAVLTQAEAVQERVARILTERQEAEQVPVGARVTSIANTNDPVVYQIAGSRLRAAAAVGLSGAAATTALVVIIDRWLLLRRHRRTAEPA